MVLFPLALAFGYSRADSARITFLLAQAGEFGFVLFGSALVLEVIDEATFIMAVGVISLSMLLTPLLVRFGDGLACRLEGRRNGLQGLPTDVLEVSERQVLIGGYGRMGHTVATLLQANEIPFVAFDTSPERVAQGRAHGQAVLYGDISDPELLAAAQVERASLVVLTATTAGALSLCSAEISFGYISIHKASIINAEAVSIFFLPGEQAVNESGATVLDVVVLEWLIVLAGLVVLGIVAAWVTRRLLVEFRSMHHPPKNAPPV